nr:zinc finger, CCHC-type [Tanacetum cinerariifolium]
VVVTFEKLSSTCGGCYTKMMKVLETLSSVKFMELMSECMQLDELIKFSLSLNIIFICCHIQDGENFDHDHGGKAFSHELIRLSRMSLVLRYIKGTKDYGLTYKHNGGNKIYGFSNSSYGVNTQEGKGTTRIIFYYGESPISWSTQKQATLALSSCESKFITITIAATQALWLKRLLSKLTHSEEEKVTIKVDNKSAIALMKNPVFHRRSKYIDTKYHFIRECIEIEYIQVEFVSGEYQKVNILTKALPKIKFLTMRQLIGLKDLHHSDCY